MTSPVREPSQLVESPLRTPPPPSESAPHDGSQTPTPAPSRAHTRRSSLDATLHKRTSSTVLLADTVRRNDPSIVDFASMDELDLTQSSAARLIAIPKFSTVSLMTVWVLSVLGSILCDVMAEVYQEEYFTDAFPLVFVGSLACHLFVLSSFIVYLLGRQTHGARVYRFYQPFAGGQRFVVMQFFGVFALSLAFLLTVVYMQTLVTPEDVRPGVFLTIAVLSVVGNVAVFLSPRYFDRKELTADGSAGASMSSTMRSGQREGKGAPSSPVFSFRAMLSLLRRSPNAETALVCALASGQVLVSWAAHYMHETSFSSTALVLVMQLCIGVLIHIRIGYGTRPGYRLFMLRLPRHFDTGAYWLCWLQFLCSVYLDVLCLRHFRRTQQRGMPTTFYYGVLGFNTYAALSLLFFVRTTSFRRWRLTTPSTVFEFGGLALVTFGLFSAACSVGVITYLQIHAKELVGTEEGTFRRRLLRVSSYLSIGFELLLSPVVQAAGKAMHGDGFSIFRPYRGYPSFLLVQGYGWLAYTSAVLCAALYVITGNVLCGTGAAIMACMSSLSIAFSLREYSVVKLFLLAKQRGEVDGASGKGDAEGSLSLASGGRSSSYGFSDLFASSLEELGKLRDENRRTPESSPTLADIVMAARGFPKSAAASATTDASHTSVSQDREPESATAVLSYVLNGEMITAFILAIGNIALRFVIDVSIHKRVRDVDSPALNMIVVAHWLFIGSVPLAHLSGRDKGIKVWRPFSGSGTYVALHVLGWFLYGVFLIFIVISGILTFHYQQVPSQWAPGLSSSLACTMVGLLQAIPLVLVTVSIAYESVVHANRRQRGVLAREAFETIRDVLREYVASTEDANEKAILQLAFTTLMEPALQAYDIPFNRKYMQLYTRERAAGSSVHRRRSDDTSEGEDSELDRGEDGASLSQEPATHTGGPLSDESDSDDSEDQEDALEEQRARRHQHEGARIIVILMSCAGATLFVVSAFFSHVTVFALACAVCGLLLTTVSCIGIHVGYGMLLYGKTGTFAVFMPFKGGPAFVNRQVIGWFSFALTFLITLVGALEDDGIGPKSMIAAAVLSVVGQVFIFESIPRFSVAPQKQPSFLEQNGEGVVAVLAFAGSISFAHVYDRLYLFFHGKQDTSSVAASAVGVVSPLQNLSLRSIRELWRSGVKVNWGSALDGVLSDASRRSKVPFVLALLSILIAVPFVLTAMARTTRQWERIARQARKELRRQRAQALAAAAGQTEGDTTQNTATASSSRATSPRPSKKRRHRLPGDLDLLLEGDKVQQRSLRRGVLAVALTNLLEVVTIFCSAAAPFTLVYLLYVLSHNYSPRVFDTVLSYLPSVFLVALCTLLLSVVPYLAHVGVPRFCVSLRITLLTYCLYGMPVLAASLLIAPAYFFPSVGTRYLAFTTAVVTILGSYKQVRRLIKYGVYSQVGCCTYYLYLTFQAHTREGNSLLSLFILRTLTAYVVDCVLLLFWVWYLPLYHGKPELTGVQRSLAFTHFLRQYVWEDAVRYFNFRIIVDDPSVHMRDDTTRYLFSFHPHGVFPGTALFCSITKEWQRKIGLNPNRYVSTHEASIIFNVPLIRDFNLRQGALSVSRRGLESSLSRGNSVLIVTGGQAEMLHTRISDKVMTLVTQHKGFLRIAIRNRVPVVPLLCFGEQNVLGLLQFPRIQKVMLKILGFPFPMFPFGVFGLPLPRKARLTLVVGKPLAIPEDADPDNQEHIDQLSKAYFDGIRELFYRNREAAGYPEMELVLVNDKEEAAKRRAAAAAKKGTASQQAPASDTKEKGAPAAVAEPAPSTAPPAKDSAPAAATSGKEE